MAKKEFKIGETFQYENVKLKVQKSNRFCRGCYFYERGTYCDKKDDEIVGDCTPSREDRQDVIFVKVEE